jgi:tRNA 2-thiouridine synthesizing protein A
MMASEVDARGLSCPQPVIMALNEIKRAGSGEIVVLVDAEVSSENVSRAATSQGWDVRDISEEDGVFRITIGKD